jgi:hypothetical protein
MDPNDQDTRSGFGTTNYLAAPVPVANPTDRSAAEVQKALVATTSGIIDSTQDGK